MLCVNLVVRNGFDVIENIGILCRGYKVNFVISNYDMI